MNKPEMRVIKLQLTREESTIKALERQYRNALRDIDDRIRILQSDELTQSRVYQIQYQRALRGQVAGILDKLHGDQYATIQQYLHDSYQDGFIGTMYSLHGQGIPLIVPLDQDAAVKAIMTDSKINEGLYASLGVDTKMLKKAISTEISRGIASNLPFADIARNIRNRTRAPLGRAKTIVRTESHRIQQAAADDARNAAKERGCDVVKQWDGTLDGATRPTHRRLDGQIRETNEPFEMDGKTAMYPGDFGKPEEDCNCRCVALTRAKWALDEDELKQLKERAEYFGLDKTEEFEAFESKYLKATEKVAEAPRFTPAKTKKEAEEYANRFARTASYDGVSLENANAINEQLTILTDKYPIRQLEEISTNVKKGAAMSASYSRLGLSRTKLGKVLDDAHEAFLRNQEECRRTLQLIKDRWAGKKPPFAIQRNIRKLENDLRFTRHGVHESYANHVKTVVTHEYGHIIADQYFGQINGEIANPNILTNWSIKRVKEAWQKVFEQAIADGDIYKISQYGAMDAKEFFAECFAAREFGETLPDYVEKLMAEVLKNGIM